MSLSKSVCKFIENEKLFSASSILICGISGGMDSMAMLHLLYAANFNIVVAHVNYRLRKEDSDKDQALVETYCAANNIKCETYVVDNEELMTIQNGNLQEKARVIRHDWFRTVKSKHNADFICLAHHVEDVAETFLMNTFRASGIRGLQSIQAKSRDICRPLLQSSVSEITQYTLEHNVNYRLDNSNLSSKYDRNFIRNHVFPLIEERWQHAQKNISSSSYYLGKDYELLDYFVSQEKKKWIVDKVSYDILGPISDLKLYPQAKILAFHLLRDYNFSPEVISDMIFVSHQSGKIFKSYSHKAIVGRNQILIQKNETPDTYIMEISQATTVPTPSGSIVLKESSEPPKLIGNGSECFDAAQVSWPLTIRHWMHGDKIAPLGLNGKHKKVSDIFINNKLNHVSKSKQLVVCDAPGEIIWIPGFMISEKVKYHSKTTKYLIAEWRPY